MERAELLEKLHDAKRTMEQGMGEMGKFALYKCDKCKEVCGTIVEAIDYIELGNGGDKNGEAG